MIGIALFAAALLHPASPATDPRVAAELKRATQELMSAVAPGNWSVWEKYADDAILYTAEDGRVLTKAQLKEEFQPLPAGYSGTIDVVSSDVRQYGDTAVVGNEIQEHETVFGQKIQAGYRITDTWVRKGGRWRLVASQVLVRLQDPAAIEIDPKILDAYVGRYELSPTVAYVVTREGDKLFGERTGRAKQALLPETETVFFTPGAPRTRKLFVRDANGRVVKIVDRRDGRDLVWTRTDER